MAFKPLQTRTNITGPLTTFNTVDTTSNMPTRPPAPQSEPACNIIAIRPLKMWAVVVPARVTHQKDTPVKRSEQSQQKLKGINKMNKKRISKCNRARQTLYTGYGGELLQWARPDKASVQARHCGSTSDPGSLREDLSRKKRLEVAPAFVTKKRLLPEIKANLL